MKKFYGVIMTMLLIFSYSCTKNEIIITGVDDPSTLKIQLVAPTISTRAIGYDNDHKESKIKTAVIGAFQSDGSLNIIKGISFGEGMPTEAIVSLKPGGNQTIWVISNVDASRFDNINSKKDFEAVLIDLTQSSDNISMSGKEVMNIPAGKDVGTILKLERLPFKVSISSIVQDLDKGGYPNATLTINKVMLFNVNSKSTVNNIGSEPVSGVDITELRNDSATGFGSHDRHFFYGMPGDTRLIIGGVFENDGHEQYVYYPIDIDSAKNNTHYEMGVTITGPGVILPTDNYDSAKLNLKLEVVDWNKISMTHEF